MILNENIKILDARSQSTSFEITLTRLSVRSSLNFLKIESLVFSDSVHDDSWPGYLVTDGARFLKKKLAVQISVE